MASVDELSAAVAAARDAIEQSNAVVEGAKQQAEELSGQLAALGVEQKSGQAMQVKDSLEQMQAQVAALTSAAEQVQQQAEALRGLQGGTGGGVAVGDAIGGNQIPTPAGASGGGGDRNGPPPTEPPTPAAASNEPPDDSNSNEPPKFTFSSRFQPDPEFNEKLAELWDPPDAIEADQRKTRIARVGRGLVRKGDDIGQASKDAGSTIDKLLSDSFDPLSNTSTGTVADTNPPGPTVSRPDPVMPDWGSAAAAGLMIAITAVEAVSRFVEAHDRRK
ncbi:hypothetical protein [Glycomyces sp. NPDC021274]|uniref:hypothetical protein n=1 Tax=Glycomyces sp. NPDC021274 TaxID=3155120 RepID=UPI00340418B1